MMKMNYRGVSYWAGTYGRDVAQFFRGLCKALLFLTVFVPIEYGIGYVTSSLLDAGVPYKDPALYVAAPVLGSLILGIGCFVLYCAGLLIFHLGRK
jgi:hypothetical protein